jgi:hypothetical protein
MKWVREAIVEASPTWEALAKDVEQAQELAAVVVAAFRLALALGAALVAAEINRRARCPTSWPCCPLCGRRLQSKGFVNREVLTLLGIIRWQRRVGRCPHGCHGAQHVPLDAALGLEAGQKTSWELQRLGCLLAVFLPYGVAAYLLATLLGAQVKATAVWEWTQRAGGNAKRRLDQELVVLENGTFPALEPLSAEVAALPLVMGADGVMVPFRPERGTAKGKIQWREVKIGIFVRLGQRVTRKGKKVTRLVQRRLVAVWGNRPDLQIRLKLEALRQGIQSAPRVAWISDGGRWLWRICGDSFPQVTAVLDFYHVMENVWKRIEPCFEGHLRQAQRYLKVARKCLRRGHADVLLDDLLAAAQREGLPEKTVREIRKLHRYLDRHRDHLDYARFRQQGLPIGSGMVESACKWLIQQRFKGVGMRWSEEGFIALLHLRLAWVNSRFDDLFTPCLASPNG